MSICPWVDMEELDELLKLCAYYESCEVQGHALVKIWDSTSSDSEPPPGCPWTCTRCGAVVEELGR